MTVAEMIAELDDYGFEDTEEERKVSMINKAIYDICSREPWPFLERVVTDAVVDSNGFVDVEDLLAVLSIVDTTTGQVLEPRRWDEQVQGRPLNLGDIGDPVAYFFVGEQLYIWPINETATLQINYIKTVATVDADTDEGDIDVPARYHELIMAGTLFRLYLMEDDAELAAGFKAQFDERLFNMRQDAFKKQFDRPDHIFVMDDEDNSDWYG